MKKCYVFKRFHTGGTLRRPACCPSCRPNSARKCATRCRGNGRTWRAAMRAQIQIPHFDSEKGVL